MYPPPPRHPSQHVLCRRKQEGNRVDTMGCRRDGERDKEKDARQREGCQPKMCSISNRNASSDKGKGSEGKVCEIRESFL